MKAQQSAQNQKIMQLIQAYAQKTGVDPQQIMQQLQQMQPQQAQQAIQQMAQTLQGHAQQAPQQGGMQMPDMNQMANGGINNPGFKALPEFVQHSIISHMAYGGMYPQMAEGGKPEWLISAQLKAQGYSGDALAQKLDSMAHGGEMIRRADGHYSKRGLWDNIRAAAGSGKKPTPEMLKQEKKIKSEMAYGGPVFPSGYSNSPEISKAKSKAINKKQDGGPAMGGAPMGDNDGDEGQQSAQQQGSAPMMQQPHQEMMAGHPGGGAMHPMALMMAMSQHAGSVQHHKKHHKKHKDGGSTYADGVWYQDGGAAYLPDYTEYALGGRYFLPNGLGSYRDGGNLNRGASLNFMPSEAPDLFSHVPIESFKSSGQKPQSQMSFGGGVGYPVAGAEFVSGYPAGSRTPDIAGHMAYGGGVGVYPEGYNLVTGVPNRTPDAAGHMAYGGIHIKKSHEGKFTEWAKRNGYSMSQAISAGKNSSNPAVRKMATFAANARKWKHQDGGIAVGQEMNVTPEQLEMLKKQGYKFDVI